MNLLVPGYSFAGMKPLQLLFNGGINARVVNQILRVMKLTVVFLFLFTLHLSARTQAQEVTISGKNLTLKQVCESIKTQTGFEFVLDNAVVEKAGRINLNVKATALKEVLDYCLLSKGLAYSIKKNVIVVYKKAESGVNDALLMEANRPPGDVKGRVVDEQKKPVAGAQVRAFVRSGITTTVMGSAITDDKGEFELKGVGSGVILSISAVNIEPVELQARDDMYLVVLAKNKVSVLEDVSIQTFNTGYQKLNRQRATGSYSKPDIEIFQKRVVNNDIISRLDGLVAGLTVMPNSSTQNQDGSGRGTNRAVLRGIGTVLQESEPLYVVNGVAVNDFFSINPQDVEDITVLKDAAATAIYGSRAANGVIVVRTREGRKGQGLQLSYAGNFSYQGKPDYDYLQLMNSRQFIQATRETFAPQINPYESVSWGPITPVAQVLYDSVRGMIAATEATRKLDSMSAIDNSRQINDLFFRNAMSTNHTISASAGTENYSFYASLGYSGIQSNRPGEKNNTYRLNVSQNLNAGRRISFGLNTSVMNTVLKSTGLPTVGRDFLPYQLFIDEAGKEINFRDMGFYSQFNRQDYEAGSGINLDYYPLREAEYGYNKSNLLSINVTGTVNVKLWKGLSFDGTYGYVTNPGTLENYADHKAYSQRTQLVSFTMPASGGSGPRYLLPATGGTYTVTTTGQRDWTVRNQLAYTAQPRYGRDNLQLQLIQEAREGFTTNRANTLWGYDKAMGTASLVDFETLSMGVPGTVTGFGYLNGRPFAYREILSRFHSYAGLANYTFDHKYSLDLSWRRDHSNLYGSDVSAQNKPTYSVGGRWQINNEAFMKPVTWVSELGLKLTYGVAGLSPYNFGSTNYDVVRAVAQAESGSIAGDALELANVANRKLAWESSRTWNVGVDFGFLKSRITGMLNLYNKTTTDLLANTPLNLFTGQERGIGNVGKLVNKGIELTLRTRNVEFKDFHWSTSATFAYNYNKLVSLVKPQVGAYSSTLPGRLTSSFLVGYSMQSLFAYQYAGLDAMGDPQIYLADKSVTKDPNVATANDLVYTGTLQPKFNGGLLNQFTYKNWGLSVNMVYNLGHVMRRDVNMYYGGMIGIYGGLNTASIPLNFMDRWQQPGDENKTDVPSFQADPSVDYGRRNTAFYTSGDKNVVSASYIKIRDITLSYNLGGKALSALKVQSVSLMLQATNFMVWRANNYNIDPEFFTARGGIRVAPPFKHAFNVGVNVNF